MKKISCLSFTMLLTIMSTACAGGLDGNGKLSLAELEGTEWILTHMNNEDPLNEDAEVTLVFTGGRVAGKSACNRYSAGIEEGSSAGDISISQSMSTMMACPGELMKIEREYLHALLNVRSFSSSSDGLVLSGHREDGASFTMLFTRVEKNTP